MSDSVEVTIEVSSEVAARLEKRAREHGFESRAAYLAAVAEGVVEMPDSQWVLRDIEALEDEGSG